MRQSTKFWVSTCAVASVIVMEAMFSVQATPPSHGIDLRRAQDVFEFKSGVIVDSKNLAVYLMKPDDGIDAVNLSSGKLMWSSKSASKPLLLDGRLLLALSESAEPDNRLCLSVLDTQDKGKLLHQSIVHLPENVRVRIDNGLGTSFAATARLEEGEAIVSWRYSRQLITGAAIPVDTNGTDVDGTVRIDLKTGHAVSVSKGEVSQPAEIRLPKRVRRLVESGKLEGPMWQAGNVLAAVTRTIRNGEQSTILKRWTTKNGRAIPETVLSRDDFIYRYASPDGRYLLTSKPSDSAEPGWIWRIYSIETGAVVAEVRNALPAAWFFLTPTRLVYELEPEGRNINGSKVIDRPLRLHAVDLKTNKALWERPYRDTAFRGPYPAGRPSDKAPPIQLPTP